MFIRVHHLSKPLLVLLFLFSIPLGISFLSEWVHAQGAMGSPHVNGIVLERKECLRFGGIPAGQVKLKIENTDIVVTAMVSRVDLGRVGKSVGFHFTGDPAREVYLDSEDDPIYAFWLGLLFLAIPFALLGIYMRFRGKPGYELLIR